jgi:pimeloyl-ACP methyl ester carboxylesterase
MALTVPTGTGNINVRFFGTQEPSLIFVHGFACGLDDWGEQITGLSPRFRCVAFDLPGHGGSALPATISIETMGEVVNQVKEQIGIPRAILIGHSMGCRVIIEAFRQHPAQTVGLIFIDGSIFGGDAYKKVKQAIGRSGIDRFTQELFADMFLEGGDATLRERLAARAQRIGAKFREELFLDLVRWDLEKSRDSLKHITIPTLLLQSTYIDANLKRAPLQSGITTPWMDAVASAIPKLEIKLILGTGHFPMIEAGQSVNDEIQKFAAHLV